MLKRLIQWLKKFFQRLFGKKQRHSADTQSFPVSASTSDSSAPPLNDTDLEFLFAELLEGVHRAKGQTWAQKWLHNIEHRVPQERWVEWLKQFGDKLLAAPTPNNELASRLVQLGELRVGEVGDVAYDIGMRLLTRNQAEPIWEYQGPDAAIEHTNTNVPQTVPQNLAQSDGAVQSDLPQPGSDAEGEYQTITLEELMELMQQDVSLRAQIAEQLGIETDDPDLIIQTLVSQFNTAE